MNFENNYSDILDLLFKTEKINFLENSYKSNPDLSRELIDFSVKANIISNLTSFVAEKTLKNKPMGLPEKIIIPLNLPNEWSNMTEEINILCRSVTEYKRRSNSFLESKEMECLFNLTEDDSINSLFTFKTGFYSFSTSPLEILKKQNPDGLITFNKKNPFINILGNRILYILIDLNFSDEEKATYKYLISKLFKATKFLIPDDKISENKYLNLLFLISKFEYDSDNSAVENDLMSLLPDFFSEIPEAKGFYDFIKVGNSLKAYRTGFENDFENIILFLSSKFPEFSFVK
jgi:hypothetical protein